MLDTDEMNNTALLPSVPLSVFSTETLEDLLEITIWA